MSQSSKVLVEGSNRLTVTGGRGPVGPVGQGVAETFETVSKNLDSADATFNYTGGELTSIVYSNGITKTFNYTDGDLTSIVLSGSTPIGIDLTKTFIYSAGELVGAAYS